MASIRPFPFASLALGYLLLLGGCNRHLFSPPAPEGPIIPLIMEVETPVPASIAAEEEAGRLALLTRRGRYQYYEVTSPTPGSIPGPPPGGSYLSHFGTFQYQGETNRIQWGHPPAFIKPVETKDDLPESALPPGEPGLVLLQFTLPMGSEEIDLAGELGGRLIHALPDNAGLFWFENTQAIRRLRHHPDRRLVHCYLRDLPPPPLIRDTHEAAGGGASTPDDEQVLQFEIQFYNDGVHVHREMAGLESAGFIPLHDPHPTPDGRYYTISVRGPSGALAGLWDHKTIVHVQESAHFGVLSEITGNIVANETAWEEGKEIPNPEVDYISWLRSRLGLAPGEFPPPGAFPMVAVVDMGVGSGDPSNPEAPYEPPADFLEGGTGESRMAFARRWLLPGVDPGAEECAPTTDDAGAGDAAHGQMAASVMAGYNDADGPANQGPRGFRYGMGVNPFGWFGSMKMPLAPFVDESRFPVACLHGMVIDYWLALETAGGTLPAPGGGATALSTNSWGALFPEDIRYTYDVYAQLFDYLVRDVGGGAGRHLSAAFAAGNSGNDGYSSIYSPGIAKNIIAVGGSEGVDFRTDIPYCGADSPFNPYGDQPFRIADNANDIWIWSSKGSDQPGARNKPDVVAPASLIYGNVPVPDPCDTPGEDNNVPASVQPRLYARDFGTSFATPAVAGALQLSAWFLREIYGVPDPSPALLKAYILHGSHFLDGENTGAGEGGGDPFPLPSPRQGFGRLDLSALLDPLPRRFVNQEVVFTASDLGESWAVEGTIANPDLPVRIVLTWSDPPAPTFGSKQGDIINDLDLTVATLASGGEEVTYYGNLFSTQPGRRGFSRPIHPGEHYTRDRANNAEAVFLPAGIDARTMKIMVSPYRIVMDALHGDEPRQDFALVISNFVADQERTGGR